MLSNNIQLSDHTNKNKSKHLLFPNCNYQNAIRTNTLFGMWLTRFVLFGAVFGKEEPDVSEVEINKELWNELTDGDIKGPTRGKLRLGNERTAVRQTFLRWPHTPNYVPIPFEMGAEMPIITRGIAQDAARNYGLRTCIHLKPWTGEEQYIKIHQYG